MVKLFKHYKRYKLIGLCGVLQFTWHCIDVVDKGVTFWPAVYIHAVCHSVVVSVAEEIRSCCNKRQNPVVAMTNVCSIS